WVGSPAPPSEPAASVNCHPAAGRARASERVTCAEPPRGKKKSADTTRPPADAPPARSGCCFHRQSPTPCTPRFSSASRTRRRERREVRGDRRENRLPGLRLRSALIDALNVGGIDRRRAWPRIEPRQEGMPFRAHVHAGELELVVV